jgi:hypothetical protein
MVLLLTTIVYDACGNGSPPSCTDKCTKWGFNGSWGCIPKCDYPLSCCNGECYDEKNCQYCDGTALQPRCDPNNCQICDGNGHCPACGDDPNKRCCNGTCYDLSTQGCCGGTIYNKTTQKCCEDISPSYPCDINKTCCYGSCCNPAECKDCNATTHACEVCGGDPTLKCYNGHCCCAPNGCGPCNGVIPISDNPSGCSDTSFLGPCNAHDDCYGECGSDKDTCDTNFKNAMDAVCDASDCWLPCFTYAEAYYQAVHLGGNTAYNNAQACSCGT